MVIDTVESLRQHLKWAIKIEMSLFPVYLYAAYSLKDQESEAFRIIRSVATEEMLHATLDANMLMAIGGDHTFYDQAFIPTYPMIMPHHDPPFVLELKPASTEVMDLFATIEKPEPVEAIPEDDDYETQGQFYLALEQAFERFSEDDLFSNPQIERQLGDPNYYGAVEFDAEDSGGLHLITDLASVQRALFTVVHQGEGLSDERWADPAHQELTHYYKFLQIRDGASPLGDVWPVGTSPHVLHLPPSLRRVGELFDATYCYCFVTMDEMFQPLDNPAKDLLVWRLYALMKSVLKLVARYLMSLPLKEGGTTHAAPAFGYHAFGSPETAQAELKELAQQAASDQPDLADVAKAISDL